MAEIIMDNPAVPIERLPENDAFMYYWLYFDGETVFKGHNQRWIVYKASPETDDFSAYIGIDKGENVPPPASHAVQNRQNQPNRSETKGNGKTVRV